MDGPLQGPPTCRLAMPRWWSPTGDEVDDLRFRLHLPNDLADLFLRQLRLGEADAVELASHVQRSLNHRGLVGAKKLSDVIRGRLGGEPTAGGRPPPPPRPDFGEQPLPPSPPWRPPGLI